MTRHPPRPTLFPYTPLSRSKTAYRLWQQHGRPRIVMYRCTRNAPLDALDPDQYKRVKEFFAQFEAVGEHPGIYQSFDTPESLDRKSTRLNSSHANISYAVFC